MSSLGRDPVLAVGVRRRVPAWGADVELAPGGEVAVAYAGADYVVYPPSGVGDYTLYTEDGATKLRRFPRIEVRAAALARFAIDTGLPIEDLVAAVPNYGGARARIRDVLTAPRGLSLYQLGLVNTRAPTALAATVTAAGVSLAAANGRTTHLSDALLAADAEYGAFSRAPAYGGLARARNRYTVANRTVASSAGDTFALADPHPPVWYRALAATNLGIGAEPDGVTLLAIKLGYLRFEALAGYVPGIAFGLASREPTCVRHRVLRRPALQRGGEDTAVPREPVVDPEDDEAARSEIVVRRV